MKLYQIGTIFQVVNVFYPDRPELEKYMLAQTFEENFVFQLICIEGHPQGEIIGYIKKDDNLDSYTAAVTKKHLINEIHRNIIVKKGSIKIIDER